MSTTAIFLAAVTVVGMVIGQVLFKLAAGRGSVEQILMSPVLWAAVCLYGAVTFAWVLLLREMDLARAYPLVAATYILVPLASAVMFGEKLTLFYAAGVGLIISGIIISRLG